jgi:hypothetical protein
VLPSPRIFDLQSPNPESWPELQNPDIRTQLEA